MLIDINLLPRKERKSIVSIILIAVLILLIISGGVYLFLTYQSTKSEVNTLKTQLEMTKQLRAIEEQKLTDITSTSAVEELKTTIEWAEKLPISTVTLLEQLTALLPERGFILNMNYDDKGKLTLDVQFDTNREAAYYLNDLDNSEIIKSVKLNSIATSGKELEEKNKALKDKLNKILVPRYAATYEIELNFQALKDLAKEEGQQ